MRRKKWIWLMAVLIVFIGLAWWIVWGNTALMVSEYTVTSDRLPAGFSGFRIAQISDLHNAVFGENNEDVLMLLADTRPDIIVMTGDLVDANRTDLAVGLAFAKAAQNIAPTYYVTGNHEAGLASRKALLSDLADLGVTVLSNKSILLEQNGDCLLVMGLHDSNFFAGDAETIVRENLQVLKPQDETYTVLLAHRPEFFAVYEESSVDLVFSGHAHGGQVRLPILGGLYAPGQGVLPRYDAGLYTEGCTTMVVSRGLGNSRFPLRVNNRPEIVVVELKCAS